MEGKKLNYVEGFAPVVRTRWTNNRAQNLRCSLRRL